MGSTTRVASAGGRRRKSLGHRTRAASQCCTHPGAEDQWCATGLVRPNSGHDSRGGDRHRYPVASVLRDRELACLQECWARARVDAGGPPPRACGAIQRGGLGLPAGRRFGTASRRARGGPRLPDPGPHTARPHLDLGRPRSRPSGDGAASGSGCPLGGRARPTRQQVRRRLRALLSTGWHRPARRSTAHAGTLAALLDTCRFVGIQRVHHLLRRGPRAAVDRGGTARRSPRPPQHRAAVVGRHRHVLLRRRTAAAARPHPLRIRSPSCRRRRGPRSCPSPRCGIVRIARRTNRFRSSGRTRAILAGDVE